MVSGQLSAHAGFESFAQATVTSAGRLFPNDASVAEKVEAAWVQVGLLDTGVDLTAYQATGPGLGGPAGSGDQPATVSVCRSGGFAGTMKVGQLDLNADPEGPEVRHL